jgi:hypothetical protein
MNDFPFMYQPLFYPSAPPYIEGLSLEKTEPKPRKRTPKAPVVREFSWKPELKSAGKPLDFTTVTTVFTIPEIVDIIFKNLPVSDICNFELVCKGHRYFTHKIWDTVREKEGLRYNWKSCAQVQFEEKTNYILTKFLFEYAPRACSFPSPQLLQKRAIICQSFPLFKPFYEAADTKMYESIEEFDDELKEEPILHATVKICRSVSGKMRANQNPIPIHSEEVLQIAAKAISEGAPCLGRLAVMVCQKNQHRIEAVQSRFLPFLRSIALLAKNKGDPSGQQLLATTVEKIRKGWGGDSDYAQLTRLLYKQFSGELSEEERSTERKLLDQFKETRGREHETIMQYLVQLERYDEAEYFADMMQKQEVKSQTDFLFIIMIKKHLKKQDEVNKLYDAITKRRGKKSNFSVNTHVSFLLEYASFKLEYKGGDPKGVDAQLMKFWHGQTWHDCIVFNNSNSEVKIRTADDFRVEPFVKLLEVIIQVKSLLGQKSDKQWFRNVLTAILLDTEDSQDCLSTHQDWVKQDFYKDLRIQELPQLLQRKIDFCRVYEQTMKEKEIKEQERKREEERAKMTIVPDMDDFLGELFYVPKDLE